MSSEPQVHVADEQCVIPLFRARHPMTAELSHWIEGFKFSLRSVPLTDRQKKIVIECLYPCYAFGFMDPVDPACQRQADSVYNTRYNRSNTPHNLLYRVYGDRVAHAVADWISHRVVCIKFAESADYDRWDQFAIEEAVCGAFLLLVRPEDTKHLPHWSIGLR
ncbi:hypothetical protein KJ766_03625 [Patescibacteria group bacterium]|nr:hypothetical protein [Patescibacteria group bacterium]